MEGGGGNKKRRGLSSRPSTPWHQGDPDSWCLGEAQRAQQRSRPHPAIGTWREVQEEHVDSRYLLKKHNWAQHMHYEDYLAGTVSLIGIVLKKET